MSAQRTVWQVRLVNGMPRSGIWPRWRMVATLVAIIAGLQLSGHVAAQDPYNCDDFATQFDAQTELNRTYPEDPGNLDADGDWVACEDFFGLTDEAAARIIPADVVNRGTGRDDEPVPAPAPTATPRPAPPVGSGEIPAEVLARVEGCAVIAISSRSVAAAGCPGVGAIAFSIPDDAPRMQGRVIITPGAPFTSDAATSEQRADPGEVAQRAQSEARRERDDDRPRPKRNERSASRAQDADEDENEQRKDRNERKWARQKARRERRAP